tara:strand:+ start:253 stop:462 length:210 start_codon:yes stop_codon:yes gene_type:complete
MDKREMKKHILFWALNTWEMNIDTKFRKGNYIDLSGYILEKSESDLTTAEIKRFRDLLQEMVEKAESKL